MPYNGTKAWSSAVVTKADLDDYLSENINYLKNTPSALYDCDESSDYTTTSTTFTTVDSTNLNFTIETAGGDVEIHFHGVVKGSASASRVWFDVEVDGSNLAGDDGLTGVVFEAGALTTEMPVALCVRATGLSAGDHTFKLVWKVSSGTATLYAGAGTSNADFHPQMWVEETGVIDNDGAATFTTPKVWHANETPTAAQFNTDLTDNVKFLKDPPSDEIMLDEGSDYTTTSTTFTDIDSTTLRLNVTTQGGNLKVFFTGVLYISASAARGYLDLEVDGSREGGDDGLVAILGEDSSPVAIRYSSPICWVIEDLPAGAHTIDLQWKKQGGGSMTMYAGAGSSNYDFHPQFWCEEMVG